MSNVTNMVRFRKTDETPDGAYVLRVLLASGGGAPQTLNVKVPSGASFTFDVEDSGRVLFVVREENDQVSQSLDGFPGMAREGVMELLSRSFMRDLWGEDVPAEPVPIAVVEAPVAGGQPDRPSVSSVLGVKKGWFGWLKIPGWRGAATRFAVVALLACCGLAGWMWWVGRADSGASVALNAQDNLAQTQAGVNAEIRRRMAEGDVGELGGRGATAATLRALGLDPGKADAGCLLGVPAQ